MRADISMILLHKPKILFLDEPTIGVGHTLIVAPLVRIAPAVISLALGILIRMLLISVVSLLCFVTTSHLGISWTRGAVTEFFSGAVIPISLFFPAGLQAVTYCTPFPLMLHIPLSIYLGQPTYYALPMVFALQVLWGYCFYLACRHSAGIRYAGIL